MQTTIEGRIQIKRQALTRKDGDYATWASPLKQTHIVREIAGQSCAVNDFTLDSVSGASCFYLLIINLSGQIFIKFYLRPI